MLYVDKSQNKWFKNSEIMKILENGCILGLKTCEKKVENEDIPVTH